MLSASPGVSRRGLWRWAGGAAHVCVWLCGAGSLDERGGAEWVWVGQCMLVYV